MDAAQLIEEIVELNIANLIYLHKTLRLKDPLPHQCEKEVKTPTTATETLPAAGATFVDKNIWDATTFTPSVRHVTPLNPHRFLTTIKSRIKPVVTGRTITHTKFATTVPISDNSQASNNKSVRNQISFLVVLVMFLTSVLAVNWV